MAKYLKSRNGRKGWFFQRSVPPDCRDFIGKATWIRKAGDTATEANRNAAIFLEETEQLIREARGQRLTPEQKLSSLIPLREEIAASDLTVDELISDVSHEPAYLYSKGTLNPRYEELNEIAQGVLTGTAKLLKRPEELLTRATLLKDPSAGTAYEWGRYLTKLMEHRGREYIQQVTRDDALAWRADELSRCQGSTVKTRLRFLNGLFRVAQEEGWIEGNPFEGLTTRFKSKRTKKQVVTLEEADQRWEKLPRHHQLLWHILRWSGAQASEVGGLRWEDIDHQEETIHFSSHKTRPLKNVFRDRVIPIHSRLLPILRQEKLDEPCEGLIFPWAYNPKRGGRWCEAMNWTAIIGVSPKATRDWAATCLRSRDINESVIGRIFGHTPRTQNGFYGSVEMRTMRKALEQLT